MNAGTLRTSTKLGSDVTSAAILRGCNRNLPGATSIHASDNVRIHESICTRPKTRIMFDRFLSVDIKLRKTTRIVRSSEGSDKNTVVSVYTLRPRGYRDANTKHLMADTPYGVWAANAS